MNEFPDIRPSVLEFDKLMLALGRMTVRFQELENAFRYIACSILDPRERTLGEIATNRLSYKNLVETTFALYQFKHPKLDNESLESCSKWFARARKAEETRNQLIHSVWADSPDETGAFKRMKHSRNFSQQVHHVTVADLEQFNDELRKITRAMVTYIDDETIKAIVEELGKRGNNLRDGA
jgi:hypothetical protein